MKEATKNWLENLVKKVIDSIDPEFNIEEIFLYGSYAKGNAHEWSDVDIALISPDLTGKSIFSNVRTIKEKTKLYEPDLQLTAFPSKTFHDETFVDPSFIQEIKKTGKKVYTKKYGIDFSAI